MTDKLSKDELLKWLEKEVSRYAFLQITHPHLAQKTTKKDDQAYQQIVALIKKPRRDEQLDAQFLRLLEEAKRLGVGEEELIDKILREYQQKSKVAEDWISGEAYWPKTSEVTEEQIEERAKGVIKKSFKDYETELQAILFVDPIRKSSYRKINKATDALGEQIWGFIRSLVKEIHGRK